MPAKSNGSVHGSKAQQMYNPSILFCFFSSHLVVGGGGSGGGGGGGRSLFIY